MKKKIKRSDRDTNLRIHRDTHDALKSYALENGLKLDEAIWSLLTIKIKRAMTTKRLA